MKRLTRAYLRSVHGQLALLGATFVAAAVLAVTAILLRDWFFERYVKEKYPSVGDLTRELAEGAAAGRLDAEDDSKLATMAAGSQGLDELYGLWIEEGDLDPAGRLARRLLELNGAGMLSRVRRTLAAGDPRQRARALDLLTLVSADGNRPEALELARYARRRASDRKETDLVRRADAVLEQLSPPHERLTNPAGS
jgi:hypothetical protein